MKPVAIAGNVVLDVTVDVHLPSLPAGRQTPAPIALQAGGGLPNVGGLLDQLGVPVIAVGAVGDDAAGMVVRQQVPWSLVTVPGAVTEVSVVATGGERTIVNAQGTATVAPAQLAERVAGAGVALFAYLNCCSLAVEDVPAAVEAAVAAGCTIVGGVNGVFSPERRRIVLGVLDRIDLLVLDLVEAEWLTGTDSLEAAGEALASRGRRTCLTLGPEGMLVIEGDQARRWPADPVEGARSLGAGDAFLAGVVAALAGGAEWEAAYERGAAVARAWVAGE